MEAFEFLKEKKRMCNAYSDPYNGCCDCPFVESCCVISNITPDEELKKMITIVEQWSKEHPRKTRQSIFLKQWPNCKMGDDGVIGMCPRYVNKMHVCGSVGCGDCRREFWMQEVDE